MTNLKDVDIYSRERYTSQKNASSLLPIIGGILAVASPPSFSFGKSAINMPSIRQSCLRSSYNHSGNGTNPCFLANELSACNFHSLVDAQSSVNSKKGVITKMSCVQTELSIVKSNPTPPSLLFSFTPGTTIRLEMSLFCEFKQAMYFLCATFVPFRPSWFGFSSFCSSIVCLTSFL